MTSQSFCCTIEFDTTHLPKHDGKEFFSITLVLVTFHGCCFVVKLETRLEHVEFIIKNLELKKSTIGFWDVISVSQIYPRVIFVRTHLNDRNQQK